MKFVNFILFIQLLWVAIFEAKQKKTQQKRSLKMLASQQKSLDFLKKIQNTKQNDDIDDFDQIQNEIDAQSLQSIQQSDNQIISTMGQANLLIDDEDDGITEARIDQILNQEEEQERQLQKLEFQKEQEDKDIKRTYFKKANNQKPQKKVRVKQSQENALNLQQQAKMQKEQNKLIQLQDKIKALDSNTNDIVQQTNQVHPRLMKTRTRHLPTAIALNISTKKQNDGFHNENVKKSFQTHHHYVKHKHKVDHDDEKKQENEQLQNTDMRDEVLNSNETEQLVDEPIQLQKQDQSTDEQIIQQNQGQNDEQELPANQDSINKQEQTNDVQEQQDNFEQDQTNHHQEQQDNLEYDQQTDDQMINQDNINQKEQTNDVQDQQDNIQQDQQQISNQDNIVSDQQANDPQDQQTIIDQQQQSNDQLQQLNNQESNQDKKTNNQQVQQNNIAQEQSTQQDAQKVAQDKNLQNQDQQQNINQKSNFKQNDKENVVSDKYLNNTQQINDLESQPQINDMRMSKTNGQTNSKSSYEAGSYISNKLNSHLQSKVMAETSYSSQQSPQSRNLPKVEDSRNWTNLEVYPDIKNITIKDYDVPTPPIDKFDNRYHNQNVSIESAVNERPPENWETVLTGEAPYEVAIPKSLLRIPQPYIYTSHQLETVNETQKIEQSKPNTWSDSLPVNPFIQKYMIDIKPLVETKAFKKFNQKYNVLRYKQKIKKNGEIEYEVWMDVDDNQKIIVDVQQPSAADGRPPLVANIELEVLKAAKVPLIPNDTYITVNDFSEPQNVNVDVQKLLDAIKPQVEHIMNETLPVMRGITYRLQHMVKPAIRNKTAMMQESQQKAQQSVKKIAAAANNTPRFMQIDDSSTKLEEKYKRNKTAQGNVAINFDVLVELEDKKIINLGFEFIPTNPPKIIMKMVRRVKDGTKEHFITQNIRFDWEVPQIAKTISQYAQQDLKIKNDPKVRNTYLIGRPFYIENGMTFDEQPTIFQPMIDPQMTGTYAPRYFNSDEKNNLWKDLHKKPFQHYEDVIYQGRPNPEEATGYRKDMVNVTLVHGDKLPTKDEILDETPNPIKTHVYETEITQKVRLNPGFEKLYQASKKQREELSQIAEDINKEIDSFY